MFFLFTNAEFLIGYKKPLHIQILMDPGNNMRKCTGDFYNDFFFTFAIKTFLFITGFS